VGGRARRCIGAVGPVPEIAVVADHGAVINVHADASGWFEIPLAPGYYNITWMTSGPDLGSCLVFDPGDAIQVTPGHATVFSQTYTSCVQGD
jgi:hypothetical protein